MSDEPATLRRRARQLHQDGFDGQFVAVMLRAADELTVRRRCATDVEQEVVNAAADVRRLKGCLQQIADIVSRSNMYDAEKVAVGRVLRRAAGVVDVGEQRRIIAVELQANMSLDDVQLRVAELYTQLFQEALDGEHNEAANEITEAQLDAGRRADPAGPEDLPADANADVDRRRGDGHARATERDADGAAGPAGGAAEDGEHAAAPGAGSAAGDSN